MEILNSHLCADEDQQSDENGQGRDGKRRSTIFTSTSRQPTNLLLNKQGTASEKFKLNNQKSRVNNNKDPMRSQTSMETELIKEESEKSSFGTDSDHDDDDQFEDAAFGNLVKS